MNVLDCEKAAICVALRYPESEDDIVTQMLTRLGDDKFGNDNTVAHQIIWAGISEIVFKNQLSTIDNLMLHLKKSDALETIGGEVYLRSLYNFLPSIGVNTEKNWEQYADIISIAGTLRQFGTLITEYGNHYKDFDQLVSSTEDPEEFIFKFTKRIERLFDANMPTEGYKTIDKAVDEELEILEDVESGKKDVLIVGMPSLEKFALPYQRSFGVIIGLRSMGKTQLALDIIKGKARHLKLSGMVGECTINSLETPGNLLVRRMACSEAGIDSRQLRLNELSTEEILRYKAQLEDIKTLPISFDDNPILTTDQLTQRAIARHLRVRRIMGMSDYAELFNDSTRMASEELRVSQIAKNIRKIAWTTGAAEILVSQVNSEVLRTKSKIAGLDNARYSKAISQAADWGIELWNPIQMTAAGIPFQCPDDMSDNYAWGIIEKNKNGPLGKIAFRWTSTYTRLVDIAVNVPPSDMHKIYDFRNANDIEHEPVPDQSFY